MQEALISSSEAQAKPLAFRLRPDSPEQVIGQQHLLGEGKPLRVLIDAKTVHSMILWGPPGVGKTTLAYMLARNADAEFLSISSVTSGVRDIREAVSEAQNTLDSRGRQTIFFIDEIHRFNKSQQDCLLPHVESGLLTLIGATTVNPSFEVVSALLSRCHVYVLNSLEADELAQLIDRAVEECAPPWRLGEAARQLLCHFANGDARRLLNAVEYLALSLKPKEGGEERDRLIGEDEIRACLPGLYRRYDKKGDEFYDQISALHKAVRGSDPDASLYWFCRMLDGGCDPLYLARRIVRMAWEDIGLSDPRAVDLCLSAAATYERLGSPEGELALATAVLYLASTTKSNAAYDAFGSASRFVAKDVNRPVPEHLRNAPTRLMKDLGYGRDYRYAHDFDDAFVAGESYFPKNMRAERWYKPTGRGVEDKIAKRLDYLRQRNREAMAKASKGASADDGSEHGVDARQGGRQARAGISAPESRSGGPGQGDKARQSGQQARAKSDGRSSKSDDPRPGRVTRQDGQSAKAPGSAGKDGGRDRKDGQKAKVPGSAGKDGGRDRKDGQKAKAPGSAGKDGGRDRKDSD